MINFEQIDIWWELHHNIFETFIVILTVILGCIVIVVLWDMVYDWFKRRFR